jgi:hypothetical protein
MTTLIMTREISKLRALFVQEWKLRVQRGWQKKLTDSEEGKKRKRGKILPDIRRAALSRDHILKIDSTKKITRKLQGTATKTVSWCTIISHLHIKDMSKPFKSKDIGRRYNRSETKGIAVRSSDDVHQLMLLQGWRTFKIPTCVLKKEKFNRSNGQLALYVTVFKNVHEWIALSLRPFYGWGVFLDLRIGRWRQTIIQSNDVWSKNCQNFQPTETVRKATNKNELAKHYRRKTRGNSDTIAFLDELITSRTGVTDSLSVLSPPLFSDEALCV